MKALTRLYSSLLLAAICCVSCMSEENGPSVDTVDTRLAIDGTISQTYRTKAGDSGFCEGDAVGVFAVNYEGGTPGTLGISGNQVDNVRYTLSGGKWTAESKAAYKDSKTHADIFGYYPYDKNISSVSSYPFEVKKDQSAWSEADGMLGYESSDFLWACTADVAPTNDVVDLGFKHRMASISITLTEGTGWESGEWARTTKSVLIDNVARASQIDLRSGAVTVVGDPSATSTIPEKEDGDQWRGIVVPQTVVAGKSIVSVTVDGKVKHLTREQDYTYYSGKMNTLALSINKSSDAEGIEVSVLSEGIVAWENDEQSHSAFNQEYIVINCETPGTLSEIIAKEGYDPSTIENLKIVGKLNALDFTTMRDKMSNLSSVNLYESTIYSDDYVPIETDAIPNSAFANLTTLTKIVFPRVLKKIGSGAFQYTSLLGSLTIPEGVEIIGGSAFSNCGSLTGPLTLPSTLTAIEDFAFANCGSLSGELILPDNLLTIGDMAFTNCSSLSGSLIFPNKIKYIGFYSFQLCTSFRGSITIPSSVTSLREGAFNICSFDGSLIINKGINKIEKNTFNGCKFKGELIIPEGVKQIEDGAFNYNQFSYLSLPSTLKNIGQNAFRGNPLGGKLEIPSGLTTLNAGVFQYCNGIETIVLPESMEYIGANAFDGCLNVGSIICKATTPPCIMADAFNGIPKDNFTVEVPQSALASYMNESGWRDFKRFSSYNQFSISKNCLRFLSQASGAKLLVRAPSGDEWEITGIPSWVTVSPTRGTGKQEINISVSSLAEGTGDRDCSLTCNLLNRDNSVILKIEQYDYSYGDGDVIANQTHAKGKGVKLIFMGDCYDAKDISSGQYLSDINEGIENFFDIEPYKTYKEYFDVYTVLGMSEDSGVGSANVIKNAKFGTQYSLSEGLSPDATTCAEYAKKANIGNDLSNVLICLILNTNEHDGKTFWYADNSAISLCPKSKRTYPYDFRGVIQHEAGGHGFGKLGDENIIHNIFIQSCGCICCPHVDVFMSYKNMGWLDNLSLTGDFTSVPWAHMIYDPQFSDYVDVYEGGFYHNRGVFRSEDNSCMNNYIPYYSAISRESIVRRILSIAGETYSFEDFKKNDKGKTLATSTKSYSLSPYCSGSNKEVGEHPVFVNHKLD